MLSTYITMNSNPLSFKRSKNINVRKTQNLEKSYNM